MHNLFSALFLITLLTTVTGCFSSEPAVVKGAKTQVFHMGNGDEPQDLDPQIVTGVPEDHILIALFEGLTMRDPVDLHPVPGVAESWTVSQDGKTLVFKIRKNAKWSNGDVLNAHDFVYSWQRALSPGLASEYAYMLFYLEGAEEFNGGKEKDFAKVGVKATDDYTLEVKLKSPTPFFLSLLGHYSTYPVHKSTIEKFGKMDTRGTKWTRPENMVSNGAFKLAKWELNKVISVVKNPNYWDAATVKLNEINYYPTQSQQTEEKRFRAGELHVTNEVPLGKIPVYQKENPDLIRISPYLGTYFYRVNTKKKPMDNPLVRRAFAMAIDRQAIVQRVTKGGQIPAFAFTPPGTSGYAPKTKFEYNPEAARKLLAEAGYPGGKDLPKVEILFNTSDAHKVIAEAVQQMLKKELNVEITLANQDWKVYLNSEKTGNYQISRAGWIGDYPDPNTFLDMMVTNGGNNKTGWGEKSYDALIDQAAKTADPAARLEVFQQAEKILVDGMPVIPIYTYTRVFLIRPEVKGWSPNILDVHPWKHVYLEPVTEKK